MTNEKNSLEKAVYVIKKLKQRLKLLENNSKVAVIGMACNFPNGSTSPRKFWASIVNSTNILQEVAMQRFHNDEQYLAPKANLVNDVYSFDAPFFNLSPREVISMDPQHRMLLEVAWHALENANILPSKLADKKVGTFIGIGQADYLHRQIKESGLEIDIHSGTGNNFSFAAGRISHYFDFKGPAMAIDTTCSSSLVSVHEACASLINGESDLALAGGVSLILDDSTMNGLLKMNALSRDAKCKTFDADADGYSRGEGCGIVVLKLLDAAVKDNDHIIGVIEGSAVNHDGKSSGLTVPNGLAQQMLFKQALQRSGIDPLSVGYIEAHGTGTKIGDPIEIESIARVYCQNRSSNNLLRVGAVKSNIGHLEAAAGIASLIKVLSAYQYGILPKNENFKKPNPLIPWNSYPISIVNENMKTDFSNGKLHCGINSFGMSGTNAHLIISQYDADLNDISSSSLSSRNIFLLSAKTKSALLNNLYSYKEFLTSFDKLSIDRLCYTLQTCREHMEHRIAFSINSIKDLQNNIHDLLKTDLEKSVYYSDIRTVTENSKKIIFCFTGQGSQYAGMAKELYNRFELFKKIVDDCSQKFSGLLPESLYSVLYAENQHLINNTLYSQPAIFIIEYALSQLLISFGIKPDLLVGHSIGELVASTVAGIFSLDDAVKVIAKRAELMNSVSDAGSMLAVATSSEKVQELLESNDFKRLSMAAVNSPKQTVVSGAITELKKFSNLLRDSGIACFELNVSHAFHSHMMSKAADEFDSFLKSINQKELTIDFYSTSHCKLYSKNAFIPSNYWGRQIVNTVNFNSFSNYLFSNISASTCFEIGAKSILINFIKQYTPENGTHHFIALLSDKIPLESVFYEGIAECYKTNISIDWENWYAVEPLKFYDLPLYSFDKKEFNIFKEKESKMSKDNSEILSNNHLDEKGKFEKVSEVLTLLIAGLLGMKSNDPLLKKPFLELGADSIILVEAIQKIQSEFNVEVSIRQLFEEYNDIENLSAYIAKNVAHSFFDQYKNAEAISPMTKPIDRPEGQVVDIKRTSSDNHENYLADHKNDSIHHNASDDAYAHVVEKQLEIMQQQISLLRGERHNVNLKAQEKLKTDNKVSSTGNSTEIGIRPWQTMVTGRRDLTETQSSYLNSFIEKYRTKTSESKKLSQNFRKTLADIRNSIAFRQETKGIIYPISVKRSFGSKIVDVDGNEYIDITMGYGVHLFGHNPSFVMDAIREQLQRGIHIGPRVDNVGYASQLVTECVGMDRAVFCNSGTHAVVTAIRIARAATKRNKIIIFGNSYHGHSVETLALSRKKGRTYASFPMTAGIPQSIAEDVIVLPYDDPASLEIIEENAQDCAAILVEPVQSRNPELQPKSFIKSLREIATRIGSVLIFDEMVVGFRIENGGCQSWFDVKADLATYGKAVGSGLPLGIVAGKADLLDYIDGGQWQYDDESFPENETVFFGGTFNQNPLSISVACAVLSKLKEGKNEIQEGLNVLTGKLVEKLNSFFIDYEFPLKVNSFGSLFRFSSLGNSSYLFQPLEMDLFYAHLIYSGIYVWEGRTCYLSTEHTTEDVDKIISAVIMSLIDLRKGGFYKIDDSSKEEVENLATYLLSSSNSDDMGKFWQRSHSKLSVQVRSRVSKDIKAYRKLDSALDFSLSFFGSYSPEYNPKKYHLLYDASKYADKNNFSSIWLPERHFHQFGGLSPNPSILAAGLSRITKNINLRAGSVVLPIHHPMRVCEDWSLIDNLSDGRVGIAFASGWHPDDFIFSPSNYGHHKDVMFKNISLVQKLWSGQTVTFTNGNFKAVDLSIHPLPKQQHLPTWITVVNNTKTYIEAGKIGAGILTNLMGQSISDLESNIQAYLAAYEENGHDLKDAKIAVLLHTFLDANKEEAINIAREPFYNYLRSSAALFNNLAKSEGVDIDLEKMSKQDELYILESGYQKYIKDSALIGSVESVMPIVDRLNSIGVTELACFIDFGINSKDVLKHLSYINELKNKYTENPNQQQRFRCDFGLIDGQINFYQQSKLSDIASAACHQRLVVEIQGSLDIELFKQAVSSCISQHEALRMGFSDNGSYQSLMKPSDVNLEYLDFSDKDLNQLDQWFIDESQLPFDLSRPPLVRFYLIKVETDKNILVISSHHILSDGWSMGLLSRYIIENYETLKKGGSLISYDGPQFSDYLRWCRDYENSEQYSKDKEFWQSSLKNVCPLEMNSYLSDVLRPRIRNFTSCRSTITLDKAFLSKLKEAAKNIGATLFNFMLATYLIVLYRCRKSNSVRIGVPISTRAFEGSEKLLGYCTNILPFEFEINGSSAFSTFLSTVQSMVVEGFDHKTFPFSKVCEYFDELSDPSTPPVVANLFNMDKPVFIDNATDLRFKLLHKEKCCGSFELNLSILEFQNELILDLDYNNSMISKPQVDLLLSIYKHLLEIFTADKEVIIDNVQLSKDITIKSLDKPDCIEDTDMPNNELLIHGVFEDYANSHPDDVAFSVNGKEFTYKDVDTKAKELAKLLSSRYGQNNRICLYSERSVESVIGMLAVLKSGNIVVPVDALKASNERFRYIKNDARFTVLLTTKSYLESLDVIDTDVICINEYEKLITSKSISDNVLDLNIKETDIAYVIYTSGSTGNPKGVIGTHIGIVNRFKWMWERYPFDLNERILMQASTDTNDYLWEAIGATAGGCKVIIPSDDVLNENSAFVKFLEKSNITRIDLFPSRLLEILKTTTNIAKKLPSLKIWGLGSERAPIKLIKYFQSALPDRLLLSRYGATESTSVLLSELSKLKLDEVVPTPIGWPTKNSNVYILDDNLQPLPHGMIGQIAIDSVANARGYLNLDQKTESVFIENTISDNPISRNLYLTGDLGRINSERGVEYLGRMDKQIYRFDNQRVPIESIEKLFLNHDSVLDVLVLDKPNHDGIDIYLQIESFNPSVQSTLESILDEIPGFIGNSKVHFMDSFPRLPGGKIDYLSLEQQESLSLVD